MTDDGAQPELPGNDGRWFLEMVGVVPAEPTSKSTIATLEQPVLDAAAAAAAAAEADAEVTRVTGQAEAGRTLAIGEAEAEVIRQKIGSMESGNYAIVQVAQALAGAGVKLVPEMLVGSAAAGHGGTLVDVLLAGLVKDRLGAPTVPTLTEAVPA